MLGDFGDHDAGGGLTHKYVMLCSNVGPGPTRGGGGLTRQGT